MDETETPLQRARRYHEATHGTPTGKVIGMILEYLESFESLRMSGARGTVALSTGSLRQGQQRRLRALQEALEREREAAKALKEEWKAAMKTPSSSVVTEMPADPKSGASIFSKTYYLVRAGPSGVLLIIGTITFREPSFIPELGPLPRDWLDDISIPLTPTMWAKLSGHGSEQSESTTLEGREGGPSAGGEGSDTGLRRWPAEGRREKEEASGG
mgnify:CR=1 FL=1